MNSAIAKLSVYIQWDSLIRTICYKQNKNQILNSILLRLFQKFQETSPKGGLYKRNLIRNIYKIEILLEDEYDLKVSRKNIE